MRKITIYRYYFTNADCYKNGTIQIPQGIQVHSTGANNPNLKRYVGPDDGRLGKNQYDNYHNKPGLKVCANAYIGKLNDGTPAIYQTLPWNYRCWLSGSGSNGNANKLGYIGYEICEDNTKNKEYFEQVVMGLSVSLDAYLCKKFNIPVDMILDHYELYKKGLASNHKDIDHWLEQYNLTMKDYRAEVAKAIEEGVQVTYVEGNKTWVEGDIEPLYIATVVAVNGSTVNMRAEPSTDASVLFQIPLGTKVEVLKELENGWSQIQYKQQIGYMMNFFLSKDNTEEEPLTVEVSKENLIKLKEYLTEALTLINTLLNT